MTIEGIFDGTAVRPLEKCTLKPNQKVFISIPDITLSDEKQENIKQKLNALYSIFGILNTEESSALDESIKAGVKIKEIEI